ncbi:MAG: tRNA (5-methylaminomethyl-2-thiouridine)(34)-methyltransferase MnmD [Chitinophagales bacterium]|nr:tRNA (5-methylaminomethyl-2-thiouridine)(34)-methyltransferase MnmD [Chitinophagales bacterium]
MNLVKTKDGSDTVVHHIFDEHYHSIHGAKQESEHVFIQKGLALLKTKNEINLFEMGFGTGLNALLALDYAKKNQLILNYYSIEAYPLAYADAMKLNYAQLVEDPSLFARLHQAEWNKLVALSPEFNLFKMEALIEDFDITSIAPVDLIFYDAFAPSAQAQLWEKDILKKMYDLLKKNGFLTTYCAKGQFKRNLKELGFRVEAHPGPPGKREMTLAYKL